jgi:hypothetical protein
MCHQCNNSRDDDILNTIIGGIGMFILLIGFLIWVA